jgi:hypothetical protein
LARQAGAGGQCQHQERARLVPGSARPRDRQVPAGREKDIAFTRALARHGLADRAVLSERLAATPLDDAAKSRISARIQRDFARPE